MCSFQGLIPSSLSPFHFLNDSPKAFLTVKMKRTFDELNNTNSSNKSTSSEESPSVETSQSQLTSSVASLKTTISSLPRVPQISRKVRACSACKKQKIRCDFDSDLGATGEAAKCVRCRKMKLDCVVNRSLQTILDEDIE